MSSPDMFGLFVEQTDARPDARAVEDLTQQLSYAQLRQTVGRLAGGLAERGVGGGDRVALHLPNSVDFVVAALACLSIGAIFVPLAVTDPEVRLGVILDDCAPGLVITAGPSDSGAPFPLSLARHPSVTMPNLFVDGQPPTAPAAPATNAVDGAAYAIYTSGTTGTPKGVLIGNAAFASAVVATAEALGLDPQTRTLCVSPFHFDGSFGTLFPTLTSGGSVVIRPRDALLFPRTFFHAVEQEGITYTGFSPSYLRVLVSSRQLSKLAGSTLRIVALGGEASSTGDVEALWAAAPEVRVFNRYGPTETTIAVTHIEVTPELVALGSVPIGRPHPGVSFYLVGEADRIIDEAGQVGELYIGGRQLMSGYWGAPVLTAEALRDDLVDGERLYRTGDLMWRDESGNYVYFDRADRVIKRSGVRISLVELGGVLGRLDGVASAVCVAFYNDGELGIVAFVVTRGETTSAELQKGARLHLPSTMLPDRIEVVESLPLTSSSKVDERALLRTAGLQPPLRAGTTGARAGSPAGERQA